MHKDMNKQTKEQLLTKLRRRYATAGRKHKMKLIDEAVELLGYHRKAAIRALRARPPERRPAAQPVGRPRLFEPGAAAGPQAHLAGRLPALWRPPGGAAARVAVQSLLPL